MKQYYIQIKLTQKSHPSRIFFVGKDPNTTQEKKFATYAIPCFTCDNVLVLHSGHHSIGEAINTQKRAPNNIHTKDHVLGWSQVTILKEYTTQQFVDLR